MDNTAWHISYGPYGFGSIWTFLLFKPITVPLGFIFSISVEFPFSFTYIRVFTNFESNSIYREQAWPRIKCAAVIVNSFWKVLNEHYNKWLADQAEDLYSKQSFETKPKVEQRNQSWWVVGCFEKPKISPKMQCVGILGHGLTLRVTK